VGDEYEVTIKTISEKFYSDSLGKETKVPVDDFIDIGIFAASDNSKVLGKPLLMKRIRMNRQDSVFVFSVKEKPYQAGLDPYNYLVDRLPDDNVKSVN